MKGMRERVVPTDFQYDVPDETASLEAMLVEDEEAREVVIAFASLSDECQQLLRLLTTEPPLSYEEVSEIIGRPIGSLGPTRSVVSGASQLGPFCAYQRRRRRLFSTRR